MLVFFFVRGRRKYAWRQTEKGVPASGQISGGKGPAARLAPRSSSGQLGRSETSRGAPKLRNEPNYCGAAFGTSTLAPLRLTWRNINPHKPVFSIASRQGPDLPAGKARCSCLCAGVPRKKSGSRVPGRFMQLYQRVERDRANERRASKVERGARPA